MKYLKEKNSGVASYEAITGFVSNFFRKGHERSIRTKKSIFFMMFIKGINILISLIYVPLLIDTFSVYKYGIWLTITSVVAWVSFFDIGFGNGLRNKLAESIAKDDTEGARTYVSTAYAVMIAVMILLVISFLLINPFLNWSQLLNAPAGMNSELSLLIKVVFLLFCIQFVFNLLISILFALQKPALASLIPMLGQLLSLILVWLSITYFGRDSLVDLGIIISLAPVAILFSFSLWLFKVNYKEYCPDIRHIKLNKVKSIFGLGFKFFLLQIITLVLYQTSNIIIAHSVGQEAVAEYNVAYKYLGIVLMVFTIIITPLWSASTDAYSRGDMSWIKNMIKKLNMIWIGLSVAGFVMFLVSKFVYTIWLGSDDLAKNSLLVLLLAYFIFTMYYRLHGYILNGMGKVNLQLIVTSIIAIVYIPLAVGLSKAFGLNGVLFAMLLVAVINGTWSKLQLSKVLNNKASGIWNR